MKSIALYLVIGVLVVSCKSNKFTKESQQKSSIIKVVSNDSLADNLSQFEKREIQLINHSDTLVEPMYDFILPKNFTSHSSSLSYLPTIHTFFYNDEQHISVVKGEKSSLSETQLDKEAFKNKLKRLQIGNSYQDYLQLNNIDLLEGRSNFIIERNGIYYFICNRLENDKKGLPIDDLKSNL